MVNAKSGSKGSAKNCPKCGTYSEWEFELAMKIMPNGETIEVKVGKGLRCPNCNHLFRHPAEEAALKKISGLHAKLKN